MPDSNERILPHATPVPMTTIDAATTATIRVRRPCISPGYWRLGRRPGSDGRRARLLNMPERIVITGAGGLLGRTLVAAARDREVLALTSAECDITDPIAVERRVSAGDVVINCAAFTKVDDAERDEPRAYAVNATGAENVAQACARAGARLIHVSTDYVFSGRFADGDPRPYEIDVLAALPDANVVRTSWIFGGAADFVAAIGKKAAGGDHVDAVADQIGGP